MECLKLNSAKDSANAKLRLTTQQKMDADRQRDDMKCVLFVLSGSSVQMQGSPGWQGIEPSLSSTW